MIPAAGNGVERLYRRIIALILATAFMPLLSGTAAGAASAKEEPAAKAESVSYRAYCDGQKPEDMANIHDRKVTTKLTFYRDGSITFEARKPVSGIYVMLEKPCGWTVTLPDGTVLDGGANGFIHEYLQFGRSVSRFRIDVPSGFMIGELYAFSEGKLPDWVQIWEPPCEKADLLVLPTHADDEFLWFGGAIPYYAGELGYDVQVVYMTNHYNYTVREHERLNGLWACGVKHYPVVSSEFMDWSKTAKFETAKEYFGYDNVLKFQVEILRRFSPRVVIAHDIKGEYGHGAHILNATTLLEALPMTDDKRCFPDSAEKYGTCKVQKCYLHLWPENRIKVPWEDMPLQRFGGKTALEMARVGFSKHGSQQGRYRVEKGGDYDSRIFGLAYTTVGMDTPGVNDMFENVAMSDPEDTVSASDGGVNKISAEEPAGSPVFSRAAEDRTGTEWEALPTVVWLIVPFALIMTIAVLTVTGLRIYRKRR